MWLVKNFSVIFMGIFSTRDKKLRRNFLLSCTRVKIAMRFIISSTGKMLACKTNKNRTYRIYSTLNHDMFFLRLRNMAKKYGSNLFFTDEYQTTQTCSNCGYLHRGIGSSKIFNCPKCNILAERDANAAKNILRRGILEYHARKKK